LLRPLINDPDVAIELARLRSLSAMMDMYELDPMKVIASCTRGMLISAPGKDFISFDFSQIEARIRCHLAGQNDMLEMFRKADASGKKAPIYEIQGSKMFGISPNEVVDKGDKQLRTAAKIGDLACGFQGWESAVKKMARQMGIKLTMDPAEIAGRWRDANPLVTRLWTDLEDAAVMAVSRPGEAWATPNKRIKFKVEGRWLYMRLPSGRKIAYLDPKVEGPTVTKPGEEDRGEKAKTYVVRESQVSYMGIDTHTRQWKRVDAYGGKWLQNATEGIGRDFLVNGLQNMEAAGYPTVATVHDQGLFEVPEGLGSLSEAGALMTRKLAWADGMPVKADGWRAKRFKK
jgi:DNA polymerase